MTTFSYPLVWPDGWPRTPRPATASFHTPLEKAFRHADREIRLWGGRQIVISINAELRRDGFPRVRQQPADPGVAVWFLWRGRQRCIPCDRWNRIQDNLQAVYHTVAALRGIERWGTGEMLERTAHIFDALPAPEKWWEVLGVPRTAPAEMIRQRYRTLAKAAHPDMPGGSHAAFLRVKNAYEEACRQTGAAA